MTHHITAIQDGVGDTLLAWHRFKAGQGSMAEVEHLLNHLATKAGVETFGTQGELTSFKPLEHCPAEPVEEGTNEVTVLRMGARAIRDNGSTRIITRAIVSARPWELS